MADPDPYPAAADQPLHYGSRLEQLERDMYEQARWVEGPVWERLGPMKKMGDTLHSLSTRMDQLEAYLGLQDGAQPIVLTNGTSAWVTQTLGGPSWRREQGLGERMDVLEDVARGLSGLGMANRVDADEDAAEAVAAANPVNINAEASLAMTSADVEGLPLAAADSEGVAVAAAADVLVAEDESRPVAGADDVPMEDGAAAVADGEVIPVATADVLVAEDESRPVGSADDVLMEDGAGAGVMAEAEQVEVALPAGPPINIVPATR